MAPPDHPVNASPQGTPPPAAAASADQPAEVVLQILGRDLETLRQQVSGHLNDDIAYLQAKKNRLMDDIEALEGDVETLQSQHQQLQAAYSEALTQQQLAQQQVWAKRLAAALATHLQGRLESTLGSAGALSLATDVYPEAAIAPLTAASQRIASLDATLQSTLATLQQDLTSYHSNLSQQISRMQSVEQQGEAILEALVARLSQQLQGQLTTPSSPRQGYGPSAPPGPSDVSGTNPGAVSAGVAPPTLPAYRRHPSPTEPPHPRQAGTAPFPHRAAPTAADPALSPQHPEKLPPTPAQLQLGMLLVVLSTLALSFHNVAVGVIGYGGQILGRWPVAAILPLTIPNSLLLLWLRMVVVVPLLLLLAPRLDPRVGADLRRLFRHPDRRHLVRVVASGAFLFLSQVLIYKAIADVGPGVAVTLLFMYPLITVPLTWFIHGARERPTSLRLVVMFAITMGIVFTALPRIYTDLSGNGVSLWGVGAALLASVAFALFLVATDLSFRRCKWLNPVPVSLLQFCTIFVLTSLILIVGSFVGLSPGAPSQSLGLYLGAALLGLLTLLGYLLQNYGVELLGAAQVSIVAASGPVVTAILATLLTPGEKSALLFIQWMGVILVTLGVISLSLERVTSQRKHSQSASSVPANTGQWP